MYTDLHELINVRDHKWEICWKTYFYKMLYASFQLEIWQFYLSILEWERERK